MNVFPSISIIIRNRNESEFLPMVLESIKQQRNVLTETIVVDNESEDNSVEIARRFGCHVIFLPRQEFSYGRGINLGMQAASSKICVLLSAHSMLVGPYALLTCLDDFKEPSVAAARFLNVSKKFDVNRWLNPEVLEGEIGIDVVVSKGPLANGCAIRRSAWQLCRFNEDVLAAEEKLWAVELLKSGYKVLSPSPVAYCYLKSLTHAERIRKNNRELLTIYAITGARLGHLEQGVLEKVKSYARQTLSGPIKALCQIWTQMYYEFIALFSIRGRSDH